MIVREERGKRERKKSRQQREREAEAKEKHGPNTKILKNEKPVN